MLGWLRWEEILVDTDVEEVLSVSAVLDNTLLAELDGTSAGTLGEDGVGNNCIDKVGRAGPGVGGGNGSLLEGKEPRVGLVEVVSDLALDGIRHVLLDEGLEERTGEPCCEPSVVLGDVEVKVTDLDIDILDGKEGLSIIGIGVL